MMVDGPTAYRRLGRLDRQLDQRGAAGLRAFAVEDLRREPHAGRGLVGEPAPALRDDCLVGVPE
jgi:hypothetical protein